MLLKLTNLVPSVTKKTGVKSKIPVKPPSAVAKIDVHNFDDVVLVRDTFLHTPLLSGLTCPP